jgi:hypothetical protein
MTSRAGLFKTHESQQACVEVVIGGLCLLIVIYFQYRLSGMFSEIFATRSTTLRPEYQHAIGMGAW